MKRNDIVETILNVIAIAIGCFIFYHVFLFAYNLIGAAFGLFSN